MCPSCTAKVQQEIDEQTSHPNLPGAVALGTLAAAVGSVAWFAVAYLAVEGGGGVVWLVVEMLAIGIGWLVANAIMLGAANKRGHSLQLISAMLSSVTLLGGRYLLLSYLISSGRPGSLTGWLNPWQFLAIYGRLLLHGAAIVDLPFLTLVICCGVAVPIADVLVRRLPPWVRR